MYILSPLPYGPDALAPVLSADTLNTHHGKHHAKYVENTNKLLADRADLSGRPLEEVVKQASASGDQKLFNQAGQAWNHGFFWECMTPDYAPPSGGLAQAIDRDFGGLDGLKAKFVPEGVGHFASGWAWLVADSSGTLKVISTHDADSALVHEGTPLLVCDVWEHAYYLDHKQDRQGFLDAWFDRLANWSFAARQLEAATSGSGGYRYPAPT